MSGLPTNYSFSLKSETLRLCQLQWGDKASDLRWKNRLSSIKSHFLLPSVVLCHLKAQSQPAIIHSYSLTPPDFLWTHGAVFLPCLQKPSLFVWLRELEINMLNKGLHGFWVLVWMPLLCFENFCQKESSTHNNLVFFSMKRFSNGRLA